jgi:hypothetical protein
MSLQSFFTFVKNVPVKSKKKKIQKVHALKALELTNRENKRYRMFCH